MFFGACFLISWGAAVTFLLLTLGFMYTFDTISLTREDYCVNGAAAWAQEKATQQLMQGMEVFNLINSSVAGLVFRGPSDYTNLGNVLAPAFETMPLLHKVEFAFSDRPEMLSITRRIGEAPTRGSVSFMQSTSSDCFLMGMEGCYVSPKSYIFGYEDRVAWYVTGIKLAPTPHGGAFFWADKPDMLVEVAPDGADILNTVAQLIFQVTFPTYRSASTVDGKVVYGANTVVVGRLSLKLGALGGAALVDEQLGDQGSVYLVDATGIVLASRRSQDMLTIDNGIVRARYLWEVSSADADLNNPTLRAVFKGTSVVKLVQDDDVFISVQPLEPPLSRFAVVIVAPEWAPFQNKPLIGTSAIASVVAPAPYAIVGALAVIFTLTQCIKTAVTNDGSQGMDMGASENKGRVSVSATLSRHTMSHLPMGMEAEKTGSYKEKLGDLKQMFFKLIGRNQ